MQFGIEPGGGIRNYGNVLHTDPISINSVVSEKSEFWIKENDDLETPIRFSNVNFPVRPGQRVRVAWGGSNRQSSGNFLYAHNYSSGESINFVQNWYIWARKNKLGGPPLLYQLATTWLSFLLAILLGTLFAIDYSADNFRQGNSNQVQALSSGYRTAIRDPLVFTFKTVIGKGESITISSSDPGFDARLAEAQYLERRAAERQAAKTMTLSELAVGTGLFFTQAITTSQQKPEAREEKRIEILGLGLIIALGLWIPLYTIFHLFGFVVFHAWWGRANHKIIGNRMKSQFDIQRRSQ